MTRLDDDTLAHHFEVALSSASPSALAELQHADRYRRMAAVSTLSRYLTERMRCFEVVAEQPTPVDHPTLFADMKP